MQSLQAVASLIGRILLSAIFIVSGYSKIMAAEGTQKHMAEAGLPMVTILYVLTVIIELGGGLLLLVGWQTRIVAGIVFLFMVPVTLTFHWDWDNPMQRIQLLKNLAIMGGLLVVVASGPGSISVDGWRHRSRRSQERAPSNSPV